MNDPKPETPKSESSMSESSMSETSRAETSKAESGKPATPKPPKPPVRENNAPAMAGLAIAAVLLAVGLWLAHELRTASKLQDCVMSGRTNCNEIRP
jgi:uncharacterized protein HemX